MNLFPISGFLGLLALSTFAQAADTAPDAFFFRDGDRAMILGDSITQGQLYSTFVESYVLSRFPKWNITFRNTGWNGDTMSLRARGGLEKGFARDLKPLEATAVTIDFGMNDARAGDAGYETYLSSAKTLFDEFASQNARVAFVTSSPEEKFQASQPAGSAYNLMLRKYSEGLKAVAEEKKAPFVDQLTPMIEVLESGRKAGILTAVEGKGTRLVPDAVHPGAAGSLIMASAILEGLNAPSLVSSVAIDATSGKVQAEKATVSDVKTGAALSFTRLDEAMPWPLPQDALSAAEIPGFTPFEDLSRYLLKVTNLTAPKYQVAVDGKSLGTFTKEQLAAGVNLSRQALSAMPEIDALLNAIKAKNGIFYKLWRDVRVGPVPDWIPAEVIQPAREVKDKELSAQLAEADAALSTLRAPRSHQWTLTPAS